MAGFTIGCKIWFFSASHLDAAPCGNPRNAARRDRSRRLASLFSRPPKIQQQPGRRGGEDVFGFFLL